MRVRRSLVKAADGDEAAPGWSDPEAVRPIGDEIEGVRQLFADLASAGLKSIPRGPARDPARAAAASAQTDR